jgi:hypothetical protein
MWRHTAKSSCVQSFQISKKPTTLQAVINIVVVNTTTVAQADCHHIRYIYTLRQYETVMHRIWKNSNVQNNNIHFQESHKFMLCDTAVKGHISKKEHATNTIN